MTKQYLDNFFSLNEKFAVVIGAAGHLCSEMARGFARSGCKVALLDLNLDGAKSVEAELNEEGYKIARRTISKYREELNFPTARLHQKKFQTL